MVMEANKVRGPALHDPGLAGTRCEGLEKRLCRSMECENRDGCTNPI